MLMISRLPFSRSAAATWAHACATSTGSERRSAVRQPGRNRCARWLTCCCPRRSDVCRMGTAARLSLQRCVRADSRRKTPGSLGVLFRELWSEVWSDMSPMVDSAIARAAVYGVDLPLTSHRKGYDEPTSFTFSYSPVRDESGHVAGLFCVCTESNAKVLAELRLTDESARLHRMFEQAPGFMAAHGRAQVSPNRFRCRCWPPASAASSKATRIFHRQPPAIPSCTAALRTTTWAQTPTT